MSATPEAPVPLEAVIATAELTRRVSHSPDYAAEAAALVELVEAAATSPGDVLTQLPERARPLVQAHSAGVTLLDDPAEAGTMRWHAIAGQWAPFAGRRMSRSATPCGTVAERDAPLLVIEPGRHYPYVRSVDPLVAEVLTVPLHSAGRPCGTLWVVAHDDTRKFDDEDLRVLGHLCRVAELAYRLEAAERAAALHAAQSEALLACAPVGIFIVDADLRIRHVNPFALGGFGDPRALISRNLHEVLHALWDADFADANVARFRHTRDTGERYVRSDEAQARRDTGEIEYYEWQLDRIPMPDGRFGVLCSFRDISERKRHELEREHLLQLAEHARAEAEEANRAKDDFLAVLSHELRAPMNAMLGWLRILRTADTRDPALIARAIDTLDRNVRVQTQVIDDLLDVSRIMSEKLQVDHTPVDLGAVVAEAVESARPAAEAKRLALRLERAPVPVVVSGDEARLQQVVANLLGNAIKFTDEGGTVRVDVARNAHASLVIEDTGQGIAPEFVPHLFERFRQADRGTARRHGGLGLGLAIVKSIVALHGGDVRANSAGPGSGARFTVTLPLAETRPAVPAKAVHPGAPSNVPLGSLDLLLVEDDEDSRYALELACSEAGARVRTVASVDEALAAYDERPPDLLVSDIALPGEDGYALVRAIRERERGGAHWTLAIAMTGFAAPQDRSAALEAGFDDHVAKPVDPAALFERVRRLVASRLPAAPAPGSPGH